MDGRSIDVDPATGSGDAVSPTSTPASPRGCVLLPDGKTLISGGYDGCLLWHDVETRRVFRRVQAHEFWTWQLALSPDGSRVATVTGQYLPGGEKYEPAPRSRADGEGLRHAAPAISSHAFEHTPPVLERRAFSPDGQHLAAANMMGEVRVWDLATGDSSAAQLTSPDFTCWGIIKSPHYCGGIYGLAFAPDGAIAALLRHGTDDRSDGRQRQDDLAALGLARTPPKMLDQIHDGEHGSGLMETLAHIPTAAPSSWPAARPRAPGTPPSFPRADGKLLASLDTKSRVTRSLFSADGKTLFLAAAIGQPGSDKAGKWPDYGKDSHYRSDRLTARLPMRSVRVEFAPMNDPLRRC